MSSYGSDVTLLQQLIHNLPLDNLSGSDSIRGVSSDSRSILGMVGGPKILGMAGPLKN